MQRGIKNFGYDFFLNLAWLEVPNHSALRYYLVILQLSQHRHGSSRPRRFEPASETENIPGKHKRKENRIYRTKPEVSLVPSVFLVAGSTVDRTALSWLERHFSFSTAVGTCNFVHSSAAISFLTHTLLTPLYSLVTRSTIRK
jgi:hypothetical protein